MPQIIFEEPPAPGFYPQATLTEAKDRDDKDYGPGILFAYRIIGGEMDGRTATRIISKKASNTTAGGRFLKQMFGLRTLTRGNIPNLDAAIGKTFGITVEETQNGGVRVASAFPAQAGASAPTPPPRRPVVPEASANGEKKYWFHEGDGADVLLTEAEVRASVAASQSPDKIEVCPADAVGNATGEWGSLSKYGLDTPF
jgi:hypothetical protein